MKLLRSIIALPIAAISAALFYAGIGIGYFAALVAGDLDLP